MTREKRHVVKHDGVHPFSKRIGYLIRARRLGLGWSQTALADKIGVSFQQVQKYENGKNHINPPTLKRMCEVMDVPASYFLQEEGDLDITHMAEIFPNMPQPTIQAFNRLPPRIQTKINALIRDLDQSLTEKRERKTDGEIDETALAF